MMTRREWCAQLAVLVSPSFPLEAQTALNLMLPAMTHLPDAVFCQRSMMQVAGAKRRQSVPAWDEILTALDEYRRTYLPNPAFSRVAYATPESIRIGDERAFPPGPAEIEAVTAKLAQHWREQAEDRTSREAAMPKGHASAPLRDVTYKGDALRKLREERGIRVPSETELAAMRAARGTRPIGEAA